jgi:large subunit ribosomal protein L25
MKPVALKAVPRALTKRGGLKKVRAGSRVPAVVYGRRRQPQSLELGQKEIEDLIHHSPSENIVVNLDIEGDSQTKRLALVQEVQHHPLTGKVLHVDLHEVAEDEKVMVSIPVETVGEAAGVKEGGVLEHVLFKIKARALLKDLPEVITVDVSHLNIGQAVHIGEIQAPAGVEILGDKKISVIAVAAPAVEVEEVAPVAGEALAEPEVIREKKVEGEGEEGEAAKEGAPGKAAGKPAAKAGEKAPEKAGEKAPEKAAAKGPEKKPEKKK